MSRSSKGTPKRAVVTGAASGLGEALARALVRGGSRVLLADVQAEALNRVATELRAEGGEVHTVTVDVRDPAALEALAQEAEVRLGGTDLLVNNAGIAVIGEFANVPVEDWRLQLDVNLLGVVWGCRAFVPRMVAAGGGTILNVASSAGFVYLPHMAPYNVSKAGVIALSETLYAELAPKNIRVTVLCPTFFRTNLHTTMRTHGGHTVERAAKLITRAKWSADDIAEYALDAMARGELLAIPQPDGKALWRMKRAFGNGFGSQIRRALSLGIFDRLG